MARPVSSSHPFDPQRFAQLRVILELLPVGVWLTDRHGVILLDNPASARIWGRRFVGVDHFAQCRAWWPDSGIPLAAADWSLSRVLATGEPVLAEVIDIADFDGQRKTILSSAVPLPDADGRLDGVLVINEDISALSAAQVALRERERDYRALFDLAGVAKSEVDLTTGRYLRVNRRFCEFTGYDEAEILAMTLDHLIYPEDRAENDERIARALAGQHEAITFERRYRRKDGTTAWGLVNLAFVDGPDGHLRSLATIQDIGERKASEAALYLQDERMAVALRAASVIMFTQDLDLRYTWIYNPFVARAGAEQGIGKTDDEMMPPDQAMRLRPLKRRVLVEGIAISDEWSARQSRDGVVSVRHFRSTYQPLRDAEGNTIGLIGIGLDITERKEAEEALRRSDERLHVALANSPITIYAQDLDLRYTFMYNPTSGYNTAAALGHTDADLLAREDADRLTELKRKVLATGQQVRAEVQATGAAGRNYFDLSIEPLRDAHGTIVGVTGAAFDITERKRREQRDQLLAEAGEVLGASLDVDTALRAITDLLVPVVADWCVVSTIEDGWVVRRAARHVDPAGAEFLSNLIPRYRLGDAQTGGVARVIATGQPFFRAEGSLADETSMDDRDLQLRLALGVAGAVSQIVVPLVARGRVLGAINACLGPGLRRFEQEDFVLLQEVASRAALALDNARLYAAEHAAREAAERATARALRLQEATAALSTALTLDEAARVAAESFLNVVGAQASMVSVVDAAGETLELLHAVNLPDGLAERLRRVSLDATIPLATAARRGKAIFLDSSDEAERRFPGPGLDVRLAQGERSWAIVPLTVGGQILGTLLFAFDRPRALDEGDRALALAIAGLCAQAIDRARLHAAERSSRSRLQQIVEALPEAILVVDSDGRFALANSAAVSIVGFDPTGQRLPGVGPGSNDLFGARQADGSAHPAGDLPLERAVLRGETTRGEQLILRNAATGADVPVLVSAAPLRDPLGHLDGGLAAFQDISAIKTLERIRDGFYAAVSHDLKNPLTLIRAHTQLAQRQLGQLDPAIAAPLLERLGLVVTATGNMNQLLGDLLDHARLQAGEPLELQMQPTDLVAMLQRLAGQWAQLSDKHRYSVLAGQDAIVASIDPRRFERVLENLLSNAVKYSPGGGAILLTATLTEDDGRHWVEVGVRDNGIGIPAADLAHIFEPYRRGSNVRGKFTGSGLGLASARRLIEQHGGTVKITSCPGEGTTVFIWLPADLPPG